MTRTPPGRTLRETRSRSTGPPQRQPSRWPAPACSPRSCACPRSGRHGRWRKRRNSRRRVRRACQSQRPQLALPSLFAFARFMAHCLITARPSIGGTASSADLISPCSAKGKGACAPPTRRYPRRSPVVAGQTAVGLMTPRGSDGVRRPASDAGRCPQSATPRVRSVNGRRDIGRPQ